MRRVVPRIAAALVTILIALIPLGPTTAEPFALPTNCTVLAFSTEEDFVTQGPVPPDGNSIISDGDLLGSGCVVCARNRDLLAAFDVSVDLGLDAVDVIDAENDLVAFSTELDSPNRGQFTAGDLLVTSGVTISNAALTDPFTVTYDIGLDAVHFVGATDDIIAFLEELQKTGPPVPGTLAEMLAQYGLDIWFSTEGTFGPATQPIFLDGDVLSARFGTIVASNGQLLPTSVPAGIPNRGIDFGLDAVTTNRVGDRGQIRFSTEILFDGGPTFTDGDVLRFGTGVVMTNTSLIRCFEPKVDELGLDALHMAIPDFESYVPSIFRRFGQTW